MTAAIELIPNMGMSTRSSTCRASSAATCGAEIADKVIGSSLTMDEVAGKHVVGLDGIPVRRCDSILTNQNTAIS